MKKNLTVLVLLVAWSLLSLPLFASHANATDFINGGDSYSGPIPEGDVIQDDGAPGDDGEGDPGDAGDGLGIAGDPTSQSGPGGGIGNGNSILLDELRLILLSLSQLVF